MNTTWIPQPNELVRFQGELFRIISVDMGGKCRIKGFTTTRRITKKLTVDISKITPANEIK